MGEGFALGLMLVFTFAVKMDPEWGLFHSFDCTPSIGSPAVNYNVSVCHFLHMGRWIHVNVCGCVGTWGSGVGTLTPLISAVVCSVHEILITV